MIPGGAFYYRPIYKCWNLTLIMAVEVFNRIGEEELHSGNPRFNRRGAQEDDDGEFDDFNEVECRSSPISDIKKEFFEQLEDDSLNVDTCSGLTRDWKNK